MKLRTGRLGIPEDPDRRFDCATPHARPSCTHSSPSPEPMYNHEGKRLNTRDVRWRKRIETERHDAVQEMLKLNPTYMIPADYRPPEVKISDKVYIPVGAGRARMLTRPHGIADKHPDVNFMGLLIGPRGNTMKKLERDTGAKVMIRGKGTTKEGKGGCMRVWQLSHMCAQAAATACRWTARTSKCTHG